MRTLGLGLALLVGAIAPVLASPVTACAAATSGEHAGLVVDTGTRTTTYCVALDDASVSGSHLIELASSQFGLDYRLGFGGRAICMLDGVGALGDDCFGAYPDYWGYFHGDGARGWTWASGSAADHTIGDGDLEGWVWGTGDSASTHGSPPGMTIEDVCGIAPSPTPDPSPPPSPTPSPSPSASPSVVQGGSGSGSPRSPTAAPASVTLGDPPVVPTPSLAAAAPTSASPDVVRAAADAQPAAGGPPAGSVLALGAIALLGAGGWFKVRRRKGAP